MQLLLGLAQTLSLGLPCWIPSVADCRAQEIYEQFLIVQRAREQVVRRHRTTFTERYMRLDTQRPLGVSAGHADFSSSNEKWARWEVPSGASAAIHAIDDPRLFEERIRESVLPSIGISDGIQTVQLAPVPSRSTHWDGLLEEGVSTVIRRGALNCGVLFYERWLSDFLEGYSPSSCTLEPSGLTRLVLVSKHEQDGSRSLHLLLDHDLLCHSLIMMRGGIPRVESHVDSRILIDGEHLPAAGHVIGHYDVPVVLRATLAYSASVGLASESYLETLPSEIHELGGTASVTDEAGRFIRHLRAPGEVDPPQQDSIPRTPPAVEGTGPDGERPKGNWTGPLAAGVASVAAVALFLALRRR